MTTYDVVTWLVFAVLFIPLARAFVTNLTAWLAWKVGSRWKVYYLRDAAGWVVYVGQTGRPFRDRLKEHLEHPDDEVSPWRDKIDRRNSGVARRCLTRRGALVSEAYRIRTLGLAARLRVAPPLNNAVHNRGSSRQAYSPLRVAHLWLDSRMNVGARWHRPLVVDRPSGFPTAPAAAGAPVVVRPDPAPASLPVREPSDAEVDVEFRRLVDAEFQGDAVTPGVTDGPAVTSGPCPSPPCIPVGDGGVPAVPPGTPGTAGDGEDRGQAHTYRLAPLPTDGEGAADRQGPGRAVRPRTEPLAGPGASSGEPRATSRCGGCGGAADVGKRTCTPCREKAAERKRRQRGKEQ